MLAPEGEWSMLNTTRMHVKGMNSARDIRRLSDTLVDIQGVADIGVNDEQELVEVKFDPTKTDASALESALRQAGFEVG